MNAFLPKSYEIPVSNGNGSKYMKILPGENKVRILDAPATGWLYWANDDKPVRLRTQAGYTPYDMRGVNQWGNQEKMKHFWALKVWNYASESICILEITQASIQQAIVNLYSDEEWGDPREYNIKINKKGEKLETEYTVVPMRPAALAPEVKAAIEETPLELEALYYGADPFKVDWQTEAREKLYNRINSASGYAQTHDIQIPDMEFDPGRCPLEVLEAYSLGLLETLSNVIVF